MGKKSKINYLDYIPEKNPHYAWEMNEKGVVTVIVAWTGFHHLLAQKIFKKPKFSRIELDEFGSFIWLQIDGEKSVYDISQIVEKEFGERITPILQRLIQFFEILKEHKFVLLKEKNLHA